MSAASLMRAVAGRQVLGQQRSQWLRRLSGLADHGKGRAVKAIARRWLLATRQIHQCLQGWGRRIGGAAARIGTGADCAQHVFDTLRIAAGMGGAGKIEQVATAVGHRLEVQDDDMGRLQRVVHFQ